MYADDVKIIAVDFDGVLCENKYPEIGLPNEKIFEYLESEKKKGTKLILWTCRMELESTLTDISNSRWKQMILLKLAKENIR